MKAVIYFHNVRRVTRDLYYQYNVSNIEIELLISLGVMIMKTGKPAHAKVNIFNKASKPRKTGQFLAAFQALQDKGYIIQQRANNGHNFKLGPEGLSIIERFDLQLSEMAEAEITGSQSINDIITGALN